MTNVLQARRNQFKQTASNELVAITRKVEHSELCKYNSNPSYLFQPSGESQIPQQPISGVTPNESLCGNLSSATESSHQENSLINSLL